MGYLIKFHPKAAKKINKLDKSVKQEIKKKILILKQNPQKGKHLEYCDIWSLRVNKYRIFYRIKDNLIQILYIRHRKEAYDIDFLNLL